MLFGKLDASPVSCLLSPITHHKKEICYLICPTSSVLLLFKCFRLYQPKTSTLGVFSYLAFSGCEVRIHLSQRWQLAILPIPCEGRNVECPDIYFSFSIFFLFSISQIALQLFCIDPQNNCRHHTSSNGRPTPTLEMSICGIRCLLCLSFAFDRFALGVLDLTPLLFCFALKTECFVDLFLQKKAWRSGYTESRRNGCGAR